MIPKDLEGNGFKIDSAKEDGLIFVTITTPDEVVSTGYSTWSYMEALEWAVKKMRDGGDTF